MTRIPLDASDLPYVVGGRRLSFYISLFFLVLPIWSVVPVSWAFVIHSLISGAVWNYTLRGGVLFAVAMAEVLFSVYHLHLVQRVSPTPAVFPGSIPEIQLAFNRVLRAGLAHPGEDLLDLDTPASTRPGSPEVEFEQLEFSDHRALDFRMWVRAWFHMAPWSSLRRHQVYQWIYWSIFGAELPPIEKISPQHRKVVEEAIGFLQMRAGCVVPEGSNPEVTPARFTMEAPRVHWRPLVFYIFVGIINRFLKAWYVHNRNARYSSYKELEYLIRVPPGWDSKAGPRPIVFIHGLGLGLFQYELFLSHLIHTLPDHPILILLQPHVSQDLFHPRFLKPMGSRDVTAALSGLLQELGWASDNAADQGHTFGETKTSGVTLLSHSNGSYPHTWMLKTHPRMVARSCFVDPITFCVWEGDALYNFVYKKCTTAFELIVRYFVASELGTAHYVYRNFDWVANSLWFEDMPNARDPSRMMVVLGGKDGIINAPRVKRYLASHGVRKGILYDPNGRHGQALVTGGHAHREILRWLREDC